MEFVWRCFRPWTLAVLVATLLTAWTSHAIAQCTKDKDCEGDLVCENGKCVLEGSTGTPGGNTVYGRPVQPPPEEKPIAPQPAPVVQPIAPQPAPAVQPIVPQPAPAVQPIVPQPAPAVQPIAPQPAPFAQPTAAYPATAPQQPPSGPAPDQAYPPAAVPIQTPYPGASQYPATAAPYPPWPAPASGVVANAPATVDSGSRSLRIAGIVCGAAGLVSIGAGVVFYIRASSLSDSVANARTFNPSDNDSGKQAETLQWVSYGVGGLAVGTGILLYILGRPSQRPTSYATFQASPMLLRDGAGISAGGIF
jgi:hypothetical protein